MRSRMQIGHTVQQMLCNSARCRFGKRLGLSNFNVLGQVTLHDPMEQVFFVAEGSVQARFREPGRVKQIT